MRLLSEVAAKAGVDVRIEPFGISVSGKGGLCRLEGRAVLFVDARLGRLEQAGIIGQALAAVDLEGVDLPRALRAFVQTGHGEVKALVRPRPLVRVR